jgi:archaetidylinositol phosphate synthase
VVAAVMVEGRTFETARREVGGLTSRWEKRTLAALAAALPRWVLSDHLTALGLVAMMVAGAAYAASRRVPLWLHLANLCLAVNWFGDSLDGTLARHRHCERPRYGFYIDHIFDAIGAVYVAGGLTMSGLLSPKLAAAALVAYLLVSIHVHLVTYTGGTFKISYGRFGATELRLLLVLANLVALGWPVVDVLGLHVRLFDIVAGVATLALAAVLIVWVPRTSLRLRRQDTSQ